MINGGYRMLVSCLLLALLGAAAAGGDSFAKKYAYSKVMTNCFGEDNYYSYAKQMHLYAIECKAEFKAGLSDTVKTTQVSDAVKMPQVTDTGKTPQVTDVVKTPQMTDVVKMPQVTDAVKTPEVTVNEAPLASFLESLRGNVAGQMPHFIPVPVYISPSGQPVQFNPFAQYQRQKREVMYSGELLQKMVKKVKAKVHILTCVLEKFGAMDENKTLKFEDMKLKYSQMRDVDAYLRADLIESIDKCKAFSMCLPDGADSPLPVQYQQIMAFLMCDKKARMEACMKADLRKYMSEFDLTDLGTELDEDTKVEKLLHVLWGADPGTDPLDLLA